MHSEMYDVITGKMREEKVLKLKTAFSKQTNFFSNINKSSEDAVTRSFLIKEMIVKQLKPFTEGFLLKNVLLK